MQDEQKSATRQLARRVGVRDTGFSARMPWQAASADRFSRSPHRIARRL
jgi:hypothetical protein